MCGRCLCPSFDGLRYFYFVFYLETDLTPSSSDVFFFCLQKILPLFSGALFLRQVLRFLFLLYSVFKVPVWPAVSSAIKIRKSLTDFHRCKTKWRWRDSNSWPPACKAGALPTELHPRYNYWSIKILNFFHKNLAATCSPTSSPMQYHRPLKA